MPKLPREPDRHRLAELEPSIFLLEPTALLHRVYFRGGDYPTSWGRFRYFGPVSRFDHQSRDADGLPCSQERGVLYAAGDVATALAETFQRSRRRIDRARHQPWLATIEIAEPLPLLDLTDTFCVRAGGSMKLTSGPFSYAQRWALGFHDAYPDIVGIRYPSSLTNRPNVMLFERADRPGTFAPAPLLNRALDDPILHSALLRVAADIGYGVL